MIEDILALAVEVGLAAASELSSGTAGGGLVSGGGAYELDEVYDLTTQIIDGQPTHAQAWFLRGVVSQSMQHYDDALADLNQAIRLEPQHARALMLRSEIHFRFGNDDQGRADRRAALQLDPSLGR